VNPHVILASPDLLIATVLQMEFLLNHAKVPLLNLLVQNQLPSNGGEIPPALPDSALGLDPSVRLEHHHRHQIELQTHFLGSFVNASYAQSIFPPLLLQVHDHNVKEDERIVEIEGSPEAVAAAQSLVQAFVLQAEQEARNRERLPPGYNAQAVPPQGAAFMGGGFSDRGGGGRAPGFGNRVGPQQRR
jgi:hypothetical protein